MSNDQEGACAGEYRSCPDITILSDYLSLPVVPPGCVIVIVTLPNTARPGQQGTSVAVVGGILAAMLLLPLSVVSAAAIEFGLASTASAVLTGVAGSYTVQQATYYSAPITLEAGHMVFTDSDKTRLKMPEGEYAITYFIVCH